MKKARVKIEDVYQCCEGCDTNMTLGDDVVGLGNGWYCSSECAIESNGGHCSTIEICFFDDGEWEDFDDNFLRENTKKKTKTCMSGEMPR